MPLKFNPLTGKLDRVVKTTTTLGSPGVDTQVPTEKAVRAAISGAGGGDVSGPASSTNEDIAVFDSTTGKLIKDSGTNISAVTANTAKVTNATHTGDVTGATELTIGADKVHDSMIDWGTGASQVSAVDVPIVDAGSKITATEIEGALQENRTAVDFNTTHRGSDGSDHSFIDQDVTTNSSPTFGTTNLTSTAELTVATGAITAIQTLHRIDTEADAASDNLDTINGGSNGDLLIIRAESAARTVVLKDGTGNLDLWCGDVELDETDKYLILTYDGSLTKWVITGGAGLQLISDAVYGAGWNGVNKRAASKNVIYDKVETMDTATGLNTTHRSSDGSDHTFIDQSVISGASPTFTGTNFTGIDISTGTNLVAGTNITLVDDTLNVDNAFVLNTGDQIDGNLIIDNTATEALLVRKDADGGDVFVVDTTNGRVGIGIAPDSVMHLYNAIGGTNVGFKAEAGDSGGVWNIFKNTTSQWNFGMNSGENFGAQNITNGTSPFLITSDTPSGALWIQSSALKINPTNNDLDTQMGTTVSDYSLFVQGNTGKVGIGTNNPNQEITVEGSISLKEKAAASSDTAAYGQLWVKNTVPCELWFTRDDGTDVQIA